MSAFAFLSLAYLRKEFIANNLTSQADVPNAATLLSQAAELTGEGNGDKALVLLNDALALYGANADLVGQGNALSALGFLDGVVGHHDKARTRMMEALAIFRQGNYKAQEAYALMGLSNVEKALGNKDVFKQPVADRYQDLGMTAAPP
jgi:hypothetical protein